MRAFRLGRALSRRRHDLDRYQSRSLVTKPPLPRQPTPGKQLAAGKPMPPRRRRNLPTPAKALGDDPPLLLQAPATSSAGRNDLNARHLRHSRMISHTTMSQPPILLSQGGPRRRVTSSARREHTRCQPTPMIGRLGRPRPRIIAD
jgi:hypothetical protein